MNPCPFKLNGSDRQARLFGRSGETCALKKPDRWRITNDDPFDMEMQLMKLAKWLPNQTFSNPKSAI